MLAKILIAAAVGLAAAVVAFLAVRWTIMAVTRRAWAASIIGGVITALKYFEIVSVVSTVELGIAGVIGDMVGTYFGVKLTRPVYIDEHTSR